MSTDLIRPEWKTVDPTELRILLDEYVGGPGQYDGLPTDPNRLHLPLARESCVVVLTFSDRAIVSVEAGPAFDSTKWQHTAARIDASLFAGQSRVGREYSFSSYRVEASWRGDQSGMQIVAPPPHAPRAPYEMADHPFILEFMMSESDFWRLTNHRRLREHVRLTRLLNVLLRAHTRVQPRRSEHLWASVLRDDGGNDIKWVQEFYFAELGSAILDAPTPIGPDRLETLPTDEYYASPGGHDGKGLRVPSDLDQSIARYLGLCSDHRAKFDRAAFWLDLAPRQWSIALSVSFASLVSAIEALIDRGSAHHFDCPVCQKPTQHEVPGATRRFTEFLATYAPGASQAKARQEMYALRSKILHGSDLIALDDDSAFGWDPPWWNQRQLLEELWTLTRTAVRNWLLASPSATED